MARKLQMEYPGASYHPPSSGYGETGVMNRGDRREAIFKDDLDRETFLATLAATCGKTGWEL